MSVTEVVDTRQVAALEPLFRAYHEWTKARVMEALGGDVVPAELIEAEYDNQAVVAEDVARLTD